MALEAKFISEGFTIFTAKDGQEALVMAQKEKPDLILLDILMSKMTGIDTAKKLEKKKMIL
jgi:CheY-like chemotaxis protein